ncbi:hypothetical protein F4809DRAFT_640326 [Biscogniauxia mediterranea]|nr:hypothetical protein F4809DRAFT_640326 [Biscogniauxia mediterranea]
MDASPSKRRVLAPLDANTRSPAAGPRLTASKLEIPRASTLTKMAHLKRYLDQENTSQSPKSIKRPRTLIVEDSGKSMGTGVDNNAAEKQSPEDMKRERSGSPTEAGDSSSIFDNSVIDTSQDTTITEPDADALAPPLLVAPPPPRQRPAMTREEARQKAEILRLRLGLASYKVRTGQTDVPLERLKLKPLPGQVSPRQRQQQRHGPPSPELPRLPSPPRRRSIQGDREDEASRLQQQRSKESGTQRKALPTAPLHRSNSSAGSSQARARTSSPRESSPKLAALPTPLNTSIISLREDSGEESSAKGPLSGGLQSGAANGLLSLSQG